MEPVEKATQADIEALAAKLTPKLAAAVLKALGDQAESVDLDAIAKALQSGNAGAVLDLLGVDEFDAIMGSVQDELQDVTAAAGTATMATITNRVQGLTIRFNRLNPRLITWLQNYSLTLIKQINDSTREGVRQYLITAMREGQSPLKTAKEVKGIVGLTSRQAQAVKNFRKELENFHRKRTASNWNLGGKIDRVHGLQVFKPSADGTPQDGIDARRLRDFRFDSQLKTAMDNKVPLKPAKIDQMVKAYERKYRKYRAEMIARTEAIRATNAGVQDAWRQAIESGKIAEAEVRRQWIVTHDERLCPICAPIPSMNPKKGVMMGQAFATPKGPMMMPPAHPDCLSGDTLVAPGGRIAAVSERPYGGPMCFFDLEGGQNLSITPNHPVLTRRGWIAAGLLHEGDDVIGRATRDGVSSRVTHGDDVEASFQQMARSRLGAGRMTTREVPVAAEDFHGDGGDSKVAHIWTDRLLHLRAHAASLQHALQLPFERALQAAVAIARGGPIYQLIPGRLAPASRCVGCGNLTGTFAIRHRGPLQNFLLALRARGDALADQEARERAATDAALARKLVDGFAGPVAARKVTGIRRVEAFHGPVFNMETTDHYYLANGIIVHNCRCTIFIRQYEPVQLQE